MQTQEHPKRRWPLRLIAAAPSCLISAILVAAQIPAVREAIGVAKTIYRFVNSTIPSFGVGAIWLGFVLLVAGVTAAWWFRRSLKDETTRMMAVGSAVLVVALGALVAVVSTLNQPGSLGPKSPRYEANAGKHHRSTRHHRRRTPARRPSNNGNNTTSTPTPAPAPTPTPTPTPSPPASGGGSSSSGGSGGNGNTVTIEKNNHQEATTGNAEGPGATSGPATNNNNEGPVNISIG